MLVRLIANTLFQRINELDLCKKRRAFVATVPDMISRKEFRDLELYEKYGDFEVWYTYVVPNLCGPGKPRVLRIEVAVDKGASESTARKVLEEAIHATVLWTPQGLPLPLPVDGAHRTCTIKYKEGQRMLREISSWYTHGLLRQKKESLALSYDLAE